MQMNCDTIYKIKDSVDLFFNDEMRLTVSYLNTKHRKNFEVSQSSIALLETIDGAMSVQEIFDSLNQGFPELTLDDVKNTLSFLEENRIITKIPSQHSISFKEAHTHYDCQINYFSEFFQEEGRGLQAQRELQQAVFLIFGCGAVGGNITMQLAMAGARHFILYDYDVVEPSDIARHIFYRKEYLGMYKSMALSSEIRRMAPPAKVEAIAVRMGPDSEITSLIQRATFVVNTLDEPYIGDTSSKISRICVKQRKAHYIAGGFDTHLSSTGELIVPFSAPGVGGYATHLRHAVENWKSKKPPIAKRDAENGGLAAMTLFSSSFACIEIIKYICGLTKSSKGLSNGELLFDDLEITS